MLRRIAHSLPKFPCSRSRILCSRSFFSSCNNKDGESQKPEEPPKAEEPTKNEQQPSELEQKMRSLQDAYLETLASMENLRSRTKKEVENASLFAVQKFSKDILSVADTLEIAIETIKGQPEQKEANSLVEGIEMTLTQLLAVLKRNGIQAFNPLHERFDPNLQNALYEIPTAEYEAGIVLKVEKKGYFLHERLLRPAEVGISKAP